ncbi:MULTISPECIES: DNA-processing protein DprA [unclassified Paraburkholderia]|uniref:DNA-processing protein DprA n=1 Tax=unclassified Paraburkholderia TaxID=2615204 RepID=UPI00161499A1|nr:MULTISPECIES: DNA-processing protein DprA [unclassified Paraburkholderia]MBB5442078.1 DNA processing protein [Paraburkholderia sp. WSM4177]MBB5483113.1 DNA processing protein [Paraburkholderia sp. WSM4180]
MTLQFDSHEALFAAPPIVPQREMGAYEALWESDSASFKSIAETFERNPAATPAQLVPSETIDATVPQVMRKLEEAGVDDFGVCVNRTADYPAKLRDAKYPLEFFYFQGWRDLAFSHKSVAVVGTRTPSDDGLRRARKLVKMLVQEDFTIFSGLAAGIDTVAHTTAIEAGGRTVGVIGTPITESYPRQNAELQRRIARDFLLVSQVPILRYTRQTFRGNRLFFPERNATMSALSDATVIVEAGETSGTLTQARAAIHQGRKLFILDSCFRNPALTWPAKLAALGAIRVENFDDILTHLKDGAPSDR